MLNKIFVSFKENKMPKRSHAEVTFKPGLVGEELTFLCNNPISTPHKNLLSALMYHRIKQQLHREASSNPVLHGIEGQVADALIRAGKASVSGDLVPASKKKKEHHNH